MLRALVRFYQTGDLKDWHDFNVALDQNDEHGRLRLRLHRGLPRRPRHQGVVADAGGGGRPELEPLMHKLADNAVYFERKAPWDERFKKLDVKPPVGKAIETLVASGDFHVTTIGDNLPNEQDIREKYGTKSLLLTSSINAFNAHARRQGGGRVLAPTRTRGALRKVRRLGGQPPHRAARDHRPRLGQGGGAQRPVDLPAGELLDAGGGAGGPGGLLEHLRSEARRARRAGRPRGGPRALPAAGAGGPDGAQELPHGRHRRRRTTTAPGCWSPTT